MSRPFNLADAKAGHPVASSTGADIEVLKWSFQQKNTDPLILGLYVGRGDFPQIAYWTQGGNLCAGYTNAGNLVMAPVGQLDGVDIYPGDMLTNSNGETVPVPHSVPFRAEDWKAPYPVTRMTDDELDRLTGKMTIGDIRKSRRDYVNAAIRHGIDNGYLFVNSHYQDAYHEVCRVLSIIAKNNGAGDKFKWVDVPTMVESRKAEMSAASDELRGIINAAAERELAIAKLFHEAGWKANANKIPFPSDDMIRRIIGQVKP